MTFTGLVLMVAILTVPAWISWRLQVEARTYREMRMLACIGQGDATAALLAELAEIEADIVVLGGEPKRNRRMISDLMQRRGAMLSALARLEPETAF